MTTDKLSVQLAKMQKELKAPKGQRNTFGNYNYRSCEDILEAIKPLLGGCALIINDEMQNIGERYYIKATVSLILGTEAISAVAYAREAQEKKGMDASQITGATSSYARKYALNGLFAIDDTKDADTQDNSDNKAKAVGNKAISNVENPTKASEDMCSIHDRVLKKLYNTHLAKWEKKHSAPLEKDDTGKVITWDSCFGYGWVSELEESKGKDDPADYMI